MADWLDVGHRLSEGYPAVERTQIFVRACQAGGYEHPDLTAHPAQIRDWYDSEDGLDLYALNSDCAHLRDAGTAITEALRIQHRQIAVLAGAWTGQGGNSAVRMLQCHCEAATMVATEVRATAQLCESLRDNLWHLVDAKVMTTIAIDDRALPQRPAWLAAAAAVTAGVADRAAADDLVSRQIEPYVDSDIRADWLTAIRSTQARIAASYEMVTDRLASAPVPQFEIPGDLGSGGQSVQLPVRREHSVAVAPAPAYSEGPPDPVPATTMMTPVTPAVPAPQTLSGFGAAPVDGSAVPAGLSSLGDIAGLSGLASRIVEAISDLLGSAAEPLADPAAFADPLVVEEPADEPVAEDAALDSSTGEDTEVVEEPNPGERTEEVARSPGTGASPAARPSPAGKPPAAADGAPSAVADPVNEPRPDPLSDSQPAGSTPCEIAADELPQAGR